MIRLARRRKTMLVLAIVMFGLGLIVSAYTAMGAVGTGAIAFALGFYLLGALAVTSHFTRRAGKWPAIPLFRSVA
jgi:hypothetical protein